MARWVAGVPAVLAASLVLALLVLAPIMRRASPAAPARVLRGPDAADRGEPQETTASTAPGATGGQRAVAAGANATAATPKAAAVNLTNETPATWSAKDLNKTSITSAHGCLCVFDVDRTLTGLQGDTTTCRGNAVVGGVWDPAYGGGQLTLSELGQGIGHTFCGSCYLGIVSAGNAGKRGMHAALHAQLHGRGSVPDAWSGPNPVVMPLVLGCLEAYKPRCVSGVVHWYRGRGVKIPKQEVYFFDDKRGNVRGVGLAGFNAHQVSCAHRRRRRKDAEGYCGGRLSEARRLRGTSYCD